VTPNKTCRTLRKGSGFIRIARGARRVIPVAALEQKPDMARIDKH
jgi:hypothetical protein